MLFCRARVGAEFEIKGEFEVVRTSNKSFQAGLVVGTPDAAAEDWYGFRMKRNDAEGELVSFSKGWTKQQFYRSEKLNDNRNTFDFTFRNGRATAYVNGQRAMQNARTPRTVALDSAHVYAGLGAFNDMNDTVIRYRNLEIRKLGGQSKESVVKTSGQSAP